MPTTVVKTIMPAGGGDYVSLNTWEAAERVNLVTGDLIKVAEVYSGGSAVTGIVAITSATWVTDATHYLEIRAATGHEHDGVYTTSKAYASLNNIAGAIITHTKYLHLTKFQLDATNVTNGNGTIRNNGSCTTTIDRCIVRFDCTAGAGDNTAIYFSVSGANGVITNSFIINYSSATNGHVIGVWNTGGTVTVENCTIVSLNALGAGKISGGFLTDNAGSVTTSQNNYIVGTQAYKQTTGTINKGSNDATQDASATTVALRNIAYTTANFIGVTQTSENLHLTQDSALKFQGVAIVGVDFDIGGQAWESTPSIGGDEINIVDVNLARIGGYIRCSPKGSGTSILGGFIYSRGKLIPPAYLGGLVFGKTVFGNDQVGIIGGMVKSVEASIKSASIGGYILSFPFNPVPTANIGVLASGLFVKAASIGGFMFGYPSGDHFAEARARTLVKVKSDEVSDQSLDIDATMTLKALSDDEFNAQLQVSDTSDSEFNAKVHIQKHKIPPTVIIQSVSPSVGNLINGARQVTVIASGYFGDGSQWKSAYIDFGEPFLSTNPLIFAESASISGFSGPPPWTTTHDYHASGIYIITARASDNYGMVGMDSFRLNLASGLIPGSDYPLISISGTPRSGIVPDPLLVSFSVISSGVGTIKSPADSNILWSFGNREFSQTKNPKTYYSLPGKYVAKLSWRYITPNGSIIYVTDGLEIGYNV